MKPTLHLAIDKTRLKYLDIMIANTDLKNRTDAVKTALDIAFMIYLSKKTELQTKFFTLNTENLHETGFNATKTMPEEVLK